MAENVNCSVKGYARNVGIASAILAGIFVGLLVTATSCQKDQDKEEIRQILENIRTAIEQKAFEQTVERVASDYSDSFGQKRDHIVPRLSRTFGRFDRVEVSMEIEKLEKKGRTATVQTKLKIDGIDGERRERLFGSPIMARNLEIYFEKRLQGWQIVGSKLLSRKSPFG